TECAAVLPRPRDPLVVREAPRTPGVIQQWDRGAPRVLVLACPRNLLRHVADDPMFLRLYLRQRLLTRMQRVARALVGDGEIVYKKERPAAAAHPDGKANARHGIVDPTEVLPAATLPP